MSENAELRVDPYRVAPDTYVIPQVLDAPPIGLVYVNSMVITGREPVLVDTGSPSYRGQWLEHAWNLVDPEDVRWVFLSHDDHDHAGNLRQVMDVCVNATLVTTWFSMARYAIDSEDAWLPLQRARWVRDGESFDVGDRRLVAVRPPFFDNPTTRGLYDPTTRVYWSVDTFGANMPKLAVDAVDLPHEAWVEGELLINRLNHPWHEWLDQAKWQAHVERVQRLGIEVLPNCHGPAIHGAMVDEAFALIRRIPELPAWIEPGQTDLEQILIAAGSLAAAQ
jgi:flavorubredoxin